MFITVFTTAHSEPSLHSPTLLQCCCLHLALSVSTSGTVCIYIWHCLYLHLALSVSTSGTVCIYIWHCLYLHLALSVSTSGTVCQQIFRSRITLSFHACYMYCQSPPPEISNILRNSSYKTFSTSSPQFRCSQTPSVCIFPLLCKTKFHTHTKQKAQCHIT